MKKGAGSRHFKFKVAMRACAVSGVGGAGWLAEIERKKRKLEDDWISLSPECQTHIKQRSRCF